MNENKLISQRTHTRVNFHPLRTSCQLVCLSPKSPVVQSVVVTAGAPEYVPNRKLNPTSIFPDVRVSDPDRVFTSGAANQYLSLDNMEWIADGKPIASVWVASTDYEIDVTDSDTRGTLIIKKNIPATERHTLRFRGKFLDWRTGLFYTVESNEIAVITTDKGEDVASCSVDKPYVVYDPLYDPLLLFDYKKARGIAVDGERAKYVNEKCYEQNVSVMLTSGTKKIDVLPKEITMEVYQNDQRIYAGSVEHPELVSAVYPTIKLDMRLVEIQNYEIRFVRNGNILARTHFSAHTEVTMPDNGQPLRGSDLSVSQKMYTNTLLLNLADNKVLYPELYYLIKWFTQARKLVDGSWMNAAPKQWQQGENLSVEVKDIGVGMTVNDSYFDVFFEVTPHGPLSLLMADDNATMLTDDEGNDLIG